MHVVALLVHPVRATLVAPAGKCGNQRGDLFVQEVAFDWLAGTCEEGNVLRAQHRHATEKRAEIGTISASLGRRCR